MARILLPGPLTGVCPGQPASRHPRTSFSCFPAGVPLPAALLLQVEQLFLTRRLPPKDEAAQAQGQNVQAVPELEDVDAVIIFIGGNDFVQVGCWADQALLLTMRGPPC